MPTDNASFPRLVSRAQRLVDRSLPTAAFAAVGLFAALLSLIVLWTAGDAPAPSLSAGYTTQNPWATMLNHPATTSGPAVAFSPDGKRHAGLPTR